METGSAGGHDDRLGGNHLMDECDGTLGRDAALLEKSLRCSGTIPGVILFMTRTL